MAFDADIEDHEKAWRALVNRGYATSHELNDGDVYPQITSKGIEKMRAN